MKADPDHNIIIIIIMIMIMIITTTIDHHQFPPTSVI